MKWGYHWGGRTASSRIYSRGRLPAVHFHSGMYMRQQCNIMCIKYATVVEPHFKKRTTHMSLKVGVNLWSSLEHFFRVDEEEFRATKNLPYYFWHFRQPLPSTYCYFWILSNSPMWLFEIWACSSAHISLFQEGTGLERDIKEKGLLSNTLCRTSTITSGLKFGGLTGNKSALQPKSGPSFLDSRLSN